MGSTGSDPGSGAFVADLVQNILAQHGVKGMKWGVRRAEKAQGRADEAKREATAAKGNWDAARARKGQAPKDVNPKKQFVSTQREGRAVVTQRRAEQLQKRADKKLAKVDGKWEKNIYTAPGAVAVHNAMADHFNERIGSLNDKHPDANPFEHPDTPASKSYMADVMKLENEGYAKAISSVHGTSPSGKKEAVFVDDEKGARIEVRDKSVQHADEDPGHDIVMHLNVKNGKIVSGNKAELAAVAHQDDVNDFLAHHGVKGMKWGVRKSDSGSGSTAAVATQRKPGTKLKTKGGEGVPASQDAKKAAEHIRTAKKSRKEALSNQELQDAIKRMQLEQQFDQLSKGRQNAGRKFVQKLLGDVASEQAKSVANTQAAFEIDKQLAKHHRPVAAKSKYKIPAHDVGWKE